MSKQKILVIGSNSFSGSHFVSEALRAGHPVWGVSRSAEPNPVFLPYRWSLDAKSCPLATVDNFHFQSIDLNTELSILLDLIDSFQPQLIVNFAAQGMVAESWINPTHWYQTNVVAQVALHDALRTKTFLQKYVHVTTPEVYGDTNSNWIKEHNHFLPSTPYAVSRAACDLHLLSFHKAYDFPVVFTRAANVYGPGQQLYRIVPRTILSALLNKTMQLHGGGHSVRSFIHIQDVVRATLQLALEADPGTSWHLSTKQCCSIRDLVFKICSIAGAKFDDLVSITDDRLGKDQSYLLDSSAIRLIHGWSDNISLSNGLDDTFKWVSQNLTTLQDLPWSYIHKT